MANPVLTVYLSFTETCRCHQTLLTNWWELKPYMGITEDAILTGVFPVILQRMVTSCCQFCFTHKTPKLDYFSQSTGKIDAKYFKKRSLEDVKKNISRNSDFSFPLYGNSQDEKYGALYSYVPLISSPGEALVVNREPKHSPGTVLLATVVNSWPLTMLVLVFSILAGITIWMLVSIPSNIHYLTFSNQCPESNGPSQGHPILLCPATCRRGSSLLTYCKP